MTTKGGSECSHPESKRKLDYPSYFLLNYMNETLSRLKKFATLLPNYWLAETLETFTARRLGRQSAERERIFEISWNFF
ncbi:hypothetical protein [Peribacillus sp. YIM B13472]|uniref:hypothetical protein n=1 Tax=Peribacillus sp. YIM B13472 TaxID=3366297 RepID=UPI00366E96A0